MAEVRDAAGHCSVAITSAYLHICLDDDSEVGNLFADEMTNTFLVKFNYWLSF